LKIKEDVKSSIEKGEKKFVAKKKVVESEPENS
jgi:hypothetical protein